MRFGGKVVVMRCIVMHNASYTNLDGIFDLILE